MNEEELLAGQFEANRGHLRAVAYRMLGSLTEAEDAVLEAWLLLSRTDTSAVANLGGWLTTVVGRVCLDMLRSRRSRREDSLDVHVHVPDPVVSRAEGTDPNTKRCSSIRRVSRCWFGSIGPVYQARVSAGTRYVTSMAWS